MARAASTIADQLSSSAQGINRYLGRIESLYLERKVPLVDVHRAYSGSFLSFYVEIEKSIQDLFMGLLVGRLEVSRRSVRPLVVIRSDATARRIILAGKRYVDWLPYDQTKERALAFFSRGQPFTLLDAASTRNFERARVIRNALAHGSRHASTAFQNEIIAGLALPPNQLKPAGFLRGQHAVGETRLENLFAQCLLNMRELTE